MRLDKYLLHEGFADTRSKAVHLIKTGGVLINGTPCTKQSYSVKDDDELDVESGFRYVSRAGYKIESVFRKHGLSPRGMAVFDVGCSTGGFSDFFLQEGASFVVGIDIAGDIVDPRVLSNPGFSFFGGVDARSAQALDGILKCLRFDIISVDVSNALLKEVLPCISAFLKPGGMVVALFKPPYEVNRRIGSEEEAYHMSREFDLWLKGRFDLICRDVSPIKGGSKNKGTMELLYMLRPNVSEFAASDEESRKKEGSPRLAHTLL